MKNTKGLVSRLCCFRDELEFSKEMFDSIIREAREFHFYFEATHLELLEAREKLAAWKAISEMLLKGQDQGNRTNFTN